MHVQLLSDKGVDFFHRAAALPRYIADVRTAQHVARAHRVPLAVLTGAGFLVLAVGLVVGCYLATLELTELFLCSETEWVDNIIVVLACSLVVPRRLPVRLFCITPLSLIRS